MKMVPKSLGGCVRRWRSVVYTSRRAMSLFLFEAVPRSNQSASVKPFETRLASSGLRILGKAIGQACAVAMMSGEPSQK